MDFFGRRMMMKKLLVLLLVFAMSSVAGAALQISVGGDLNPMDSEIYLTPSETIMLDIWSTIPIASGGEGEGMWALTAQTTDASISGGLAAIAHADWTLIIADDAIGAGVTDLPPGENGVMGGIFTFGSDIPADTAIFDEIIFHCEWMPNDVTVTLWELDAFQQVVGIWDTVVIHQVPEPMTIALLGLGGLFLLRRRR
jgi:hypothetical protein